MQRSDFIDTWRTVAIGLVIFSHLAMTNRFASCGYTGVCIFFFISGFVVSKSALREYRNTGNFSVPAFYVRRAFRIIPPLLIYLGTCAVLAKNGAIDASASQLVLGALYVCNINLVDCGWFAGHTWSLAFEEQFYFLFPLLFLLSMKWDWRIGCLAAIGAVAALPAFFWPLNFVGRSGWPLVYGLFSLGYWFARGGDRWREWKHPNFLFALAAGVTFVPIAFATSVTETQIMRTVSLVSIPVLVLSVNHPDFVLRRAFSLRSVVLVGQASYSIYLWQQLITSGVFKSLPEKLAAVAAMVFGCILLFKYVERPLVALGRSLAETRANSKP